jgi:phosphoserine phosphatase RsbU/P
MRSSNPSQILLCTDAASELGDVRHLLQDAQFEVNRHTIGECDPKGINGYHAVILDASRNVAECQALCQRLRTQIGDGFLPTLFITADLTPASRLASLESGADAYLLRPFDPAELLAQVRALLRNKERHDRLAQKTAEIHRINKRLQQAYHQIDEELELARRIQESFLPRTLPQLPQVRFAVHYQPCSRVGGDFYDIFRLDENHLGFYVADAMGHGVPASLLTIFVKTGVRAKEINGKQYRLVPPNEVLGQLNRDLIQQQLSDTPFITMVYALYNYRERTFSFSRSGHPHPVYLPRAGEPQLWPAEGSLLGVFDTHYTVRTQQLLPGDKVLLYTDGIDAAGYDGTPPGVQSLLAYAGKYREAPIEELVRLVPLELFKATRQTDDLTVLGMEILAEPSSQA